MNRLYYGDCLTIMQDWPLQSVDLIYLDPPFNSNRQYNSIYKDETGRPLPDQIEAFCDMWELDAERERAIRTMPVLMRESGLDDSVAELWRLWMQALRGTQPRLLAYLSYMAQRLLIMKRILKPTGSIYYHCDPTASHYIKATDGRCFWAWQFRNEIHPSPPIQPTLPKPRNDSELLEDDALEVIRSIFEKERLEYTVGMSYQPSAVQLLNDSVKATTINQACVEGVPCVMFGI